MRVSQVMATKIHTVLPLTPFGEILELLIKQRVSGIPVVDKRCRLVGIISEKDLLSHLFPSIEEFYHDIHYYWNHKHIETEAIKITKLTARELMTTEVITVKPTDHVLRACAMLLVHRIRRLPVVDKNKLVGIITTNNLYKNYLEYLLHRQSSITNAKML